MRQQQQQQHNWQHRHARKLLSMMRGASLSDWLWFIAFSRLRSQVYIYSHEAHSVYTPEGEEVEWPVIWILARYHKKHILCSKAVPRIDSVVRDLVEWTHRLKWRWHFRADTGTKPSITMRYRRLPKCDHLVAPEVEWMVRNMRDCVLQECRKAISWVKYHRSYANILPLTSLGLRLLRKSRYKAIPNDKDGGYALESRIEHRQVHEEILGMTIYEELPGFTIDCEIDRAKESYAQLCLKIAKHCNEPRLTHELRKSLQHGSLVATLKPTCKSHKPPGEVAHRPVRALPNYAFTGCSKWISKVLMGNLRERPYLVKDTAQFIRSISQHRVKASHFFMKLDIKDYYLSGGNDALCGASSKLVPPNTQPLFEQTLMTLLHYQLVKSSELEGRYWRVVQGTGMGLPHSGEVADHLLH